MIDAIIKRIFDRRFQCGMGILAGLLSAGTILVGFLAGATLAFPFLVFLGPTALAAGSLLAGVTGGMIGLWVALDHFGLLGNRGLRDRIERKLESLAELPFDTRDRSVRFVGLSHPCREGIFRWDTDDDVGFLEVTEEGLRYRGDNLSFDVPLEDFQSVELVPVGGLMPRSLKRVRIALREGEPFDEINFDSRQFDRYFAAQRDTHSLYHKLRHLLRQARSQAAAVEAPATLREAVEEENLHLVEGVAEERENLPQKVQEG